MSGKVNPINQQKRAGEVPSLECHSMPSWTEADLNLTLASLSGTKGPRVRPEPELLDIVAGNYEGNRGSDSMRIL